MYSCALPASIPHPFSVVLGGFPPLFVLVLLYHPFPFLSLSSLLYFILSIWFLTLLLCSSFSQCRWVLGISDCGWWVSTEALCPTRASAPLLLVGVRGWGHHGREEFCMSQWRELSCQ